MSLSLNEAPGEQHGLNKYQNVANAPISLKKMRMEAKNQWEKIKFMKGILQLEARESSDENTTKITGCRRHLLGLLVIKDWCPWAGIWSL